MNTKCIRKSFVGGWLPALGGTSLVLLLSLFQVDGFDILVAGYGSGVVQQFNAASGSSTTFAGGLSSPIGLAFDGAGNIYVADYGVSTIYRYSPNGVRTTFATVGLQNPMGLAVDGAGNVYAANLWGNNITKYTPDGVESVFANVSSPKGLTFDSAGKLYVSTAGNTILQYDSHGNSVVLANASKGLNGPSGMKFDAQGDLFVANYFSANILKRDPSGNWSVYATIPPGYNNPLDLALGPDGSMYVSCAGNFIEKYDAQGTGTVFAPTRNGPWGIAIKPEPKAISPPTIVCPLPLILECTNGSAAGAVQAGVLDTNGFALEVTWAVDGVPYQTNDIPSGGALTESNVTFVANFESGEHSVVVSASNGRTTPATCSTTVTVSDTKPPEILNIIAKPDVLWPPNHQMIPVRLILNAVDNCDSSLTAQITRVTCNQAPGHFAPDWTITGPLTVDLRSEQSSGKRRIYTVYVDVTDSSGNKTTTMTTVTVPKSIARLRGEYHEGRDAE